jgi:hypothetical protein
MRAEGKNINLKVMKYSTIIQAVILLNYGPFSICIRLKGKPHEVRIGYVQYSLKRHGNEADFLVFLQKAVPHESPTLPLEPFRFSLRIRGDNHNRKTSFKLPESGSRQDCLEIQFF